MGAILIDQNDNWSSGRKWLDMQEYLAWREEEKKDIPGNEVAS